MRISNLALNVDVDTTTNQLFIGGKPVQLDAGFIKNLVQEQLATVDVQQAPPSQTRTKQAAAKAPAKTAAKAPEAAPKRGPGRPPKSQVQAAEKRGPGRPKKLVDAKVVKKAATGKEGNGAHMTGVWVVRRARAKKGLCIFCKDNTKSMPDSQFCKTHYEAKYNAAAGK